MAGSTKAPIWGLFSLTEEEARQNRDRLRNEIGRCGPDITDWLVVEMNRWRDFALAADSSNPSNLTGYASTLYILAALGWSARYYSDFDGTSTEFLAFEGDTQVSPVLCPNTVTVCGKCIHISEIGNIVFGYVGGALGVDPFTFNIGENAANRGQSPRADWGSVRLGYHLGSNSRVATGSDLCSILTPAPDRNPGLPLSNEQLLWGMTHIETPTHCTPCTEYTVNAERNHTTFGSLRPDIQFFRGIPLPDVANLPKRIIAE